MLLWSFLFNKWALRFFQLCILHLKFTNLEQWLESGSPATNLVSEIISNANTTQNHAAQTRVEHDFSEKTEHVLVRATAGGLQPR